MLLRKMHERKMNKLESKSKDYIKKNYVPDFYQKLSPGFKSYTKFYDDLLLSKINEEKKQLRRVATQKEDLSKNLSAPEKEKTGENPSKTVDADVRYSVRSVGYDVEEIKTAMDKVEKEIPYWTRSALDRNSNKTFAEHMLHIIEEKGFREAEVYRAANMDRRLFSKIVSEQGYKPSKDSCIALCLGLRLTVEEAGDLLGRAGYVLSHSIQRDLVIEYFFSERRYDLGVMNEILIRLGYKPVGREMS